LGDGEIELCLQKDIDRHSVLTEDDWSLDEILSASDNCAFLNKECIDLTTEDFEKEEVEIIKKNY